LAIDALGDGELSGLVATHGDHVDGGLVLVVTVRSGPDEGDFVALGRDARFAHGRDVVIISRTNSFHISPVRADGQ
jgi:predicted TPR repeat methyltransferase